MSQLNIKKISIPTKNVTAIEKIDDNHMAFATEDGELNIVNLISGERIYSLIEKHSIEDLVLIEDGLIAFVMTGSKFTYAKTWKFKKNKRAKTLHKSSYRSDGICKFSGKLGQYVAIFPDLFCVKVIRIEDNKVIRQFSEEDRGSQFLHVSQLVSGEIIWLSLDQSFGDENKGALFCICDPQTGELVKKQNITDEDIESGFFPPSLMGQVVYSSCTKLANDQFAIGYYNGVVRIWDIGSDSKARFFQANDEDINSVADLSERHFVTESNGTIKVWRKDSLENIGSVSINDGDLQLLKQFSSNRIACYGKYSGNLEIVEFDIS